MDQRTPKDLILLDSFDFKQSLTEVVSVKSTEIFHDFVQSMTLTGVKNNYHTAETWLFTLNFFT